MPTYVLIKSGNIIETRDYPTQPADIPHKQIVWLPLEVTKPNFDSATQVRTGPVDTILPDKVTRVWTVRAKTAAELDADKVLQVDGLDAALLKVAFNHENRIRTLEARAQITFAQFNDAVKALL